MQKEIIAVIFGGKSAEHDISIITGLQVLSNIDREKFDVLPLYLSREGKMFYDEKLAQVETFVNFNEKKFKRVSFDMGNRSVFIGNDKRKRFMPIDCAIVCCHGLNGEDGTLQGVLELAEIPYSSCGVLSSALCMDKVVMKYVLNVNGIKTAKHSYFYKTDYFLNEEKILNEIENSLNYPLFVKPANLGSSIGISKAKSRYELESAVEIAINYDSKILVEESIENAVEVNCAILGNSDYQLASTVEYPKSWGEFLSFDEKYIQRGKSINEQNLDIQYVDMENSSLKEDEKRGCQIKNSSKLSSEIETKIQDIAKDAFKLFDCSGVVRIDFLVVGLDSIYLNELNSIPGSLAFYLFKEKYNFKQLLNRLIDIAKKQRNKKDSNKFSYQSGALVNFGEGNKINKHTK